MKTRLFLPGIVLALGLSSFIQPVSILKDNNTSTTFRTALPAGDYCSIYGITSLLKNGSEVGSQFSDYLFYFCSDNNFSLYTPTWVANGTWSMDEKSGIVVISSDAPDPWVNGTWQLVEHSEERMVMQHEANGSFWTITLERRQR